MGERTQGLIASFAGREKEQDRGSTTTATGTRSLGNGDLAIASPTTKSVGAMGGSPICTDRD